MACLSASVKVCALFDGIRSSKGSANERSNRLACARCAFDGAATGNINDNFGGLQLVMMATATAVAGGCLPASRRWRRRSDLTACRCSVQLRPLPTIDEPPPAPMLSPLRFSRLANWVAPGHLLVGRYPLVDPHEAESRTHLRKLVVDAKVSTFVCLQSEVPSQNATSEWPRHGIKVRGRLCLPYAALARGWAKPGSLSFIHHPIDDRSISGPEELVALLDDLEERTRSGQVLYLHCMGGRGRSAALAGCLLRRLYALNGDDALQMVQLGYDSRQYDKSVAPETEAQRELVRSMVV